MVKLQKFKQNNNKNKIKIMLISLAIIMVGIITFIIAKTYAIYSEKNSYDVIKSKIGDFRNVEILYSLGKNNITETIPDKNTGYVVEDVICENGATAEWDNENWHVTNVNYNGNKSDICKVIYKKQFTPTVGDYVKMTPSLDKFEITSDMSGCEAGVTCGDITDGRNYIINPSELNMWQIIKINNDNTVEMVSVYLTSKPIYFYGKKGYINFIGTLNKIANAYQNSQYTISARNIGYNGQTEYLTNIANTVNSTIATAPWTANTSNNSNESKGGGDVLYTYDTAEDIGLVYKATGNTIDAYVVNKNSKSDYWISSRFYRYYNSTHWGYFGRAYSSKTGIYYSDLYSYTSDNGFYGATKAKLFRPIVTLKSGLTTSGGDGKSEETAWLFE